MFQTCKKYLLPALLSVILFTIMFPVATGGDVWPIERWSCIFAWVFLVPIWLALRNESFKRILWVGYIYCFFSTIGTLYWFYIAMQKYGDMPPWEAFLILMGAGFLVGTIRWFAFLITAKFQNIPRFPLFAALIFSITEWSMIYIPFNGFPWITPAYAVLPMHHLVQIVDVVGMTGINFFLFYTNFTLVERLVQYRDGKTPCKKPMIAVLVGLILLYAYGAIQIRSYEFPADTDRALNVALLQGNISQDIKWSVQERQSIIDTYHGLTHLAAQANPDLIVWPEASFPKTTHVEETRLRALPEDMTKGTFVVGAPTWYKKDGKTMYQNSAFTLSPDGTILHRYDKVKLVPFGEYIPSFGVPVEKLVPAIAGSFSSGGLNQDISQVKDYPFGLFICFEVLTPTVAQTWVDKGAEFFVNITNDAWFDRSSGPHQHLRFAAMRTIEFRKPLVRSANTGITTWFDATGAQQESLELFQRGFITAAIHPNKVITFYARFPHLIPVFLWLATLYIIVFQRRRKA